MRNETHVHSLMTVCKYFFIPILFLIVINQAVPQQADAVVLYREGNYSAALDVCRAEIAINPSNLESYVVGCWALLKLKRYNEAASYSEKAVKLARYDVRVIEILGEVNYFQGKNANALQYFREYINLAPEGQRIDVVYYYMGEIYIRLSRFKYADIAISTALHYVPNNTDWWLRLAYAREMASDTREALFAYTRALELNSSLVDAKQGVERTRNALQGR